jgi:hypothetical protein
VPEAVDRVVLRGTASDPAKRYESARDMARDLEEAIACAGPTEVGEWVAAHAADELLAHAARIAEIEQSSESLPMLDAETLDAELRSETFTVAAAPDARKKAVTTRARAPRDRARKGATRVAIAIAALGGCAAAAWWIERAPARPRAATPPAVSAAAVRMTSAALDTNATATATAAPVAVAEVVAPAAHANGAANADGTATIAPSAQRQDGARRAQAKSASPAHPAQQSRDCDPPSVTDERGHVHFKPECF